MLCRIIGDTVLVKVVGPEIPRFNIVAHLDVQNVPEFLPDIFVKYRANDFNTVIEISRHPVGR